jgi:hypothetical protein
VRAAFREQIALASPILLIAGDDDYLVFDSMHELLLSRLHHLSSIVNRRMRAFCRACAPRFLNPYCCHSTTMADYRLCQSRMRSVQPLKVSKRMLRKIMHSTSG